MRLQLSILRHSLPPVQFIFTTGSGPASHTTSRSTSTVADLLHDVNDIVPLESDDGEWGLEDYVVEVAATLEQELSYECLHFQTLKSVLRDDDEVVIRSLSTDELRVRRLGGRHQISGDGRHLIDGVAFGKRWLRVGGRPGIVIPPRKKRRMEIEENEDVMQITESGHDWTAGALVRLPDEDEDDDEEDDEDFLDEQGEEQVGVVAVREVFQDADESSEIDENEFEGDELENELQQLLRDAAEVEDAGPGTARRDVLEKQLHTARPRKRKRELDDEGDDNSDNDIFEGFATPAKSSATTIVASAAQSDDEDEGEVSDSGSGSESDPDSDSNSDSGSDSDADSISDSEPERVLEMTHIATRKTTQEEQIDSDMTSSSGITSSDSDDSDLSSSSSISADDDLTSSSSISADDDLTSSSSSDSDSARDSNSTSSSKSNNSSESDQDSDLQRKRQHQSSLEPPVSSPVVAKSAPLKASPPGQGKAKTRNRNSRAKIRKRLEALKAEGVLPTDANFEDLRTYESSQAPEALPEIETESDVEAARLRLLEQFKTPAVALDSISIRPIDKLMSQGLSSKSNMADAPFETADVADSSTVAHETVSEEVLEQSVQTPERRPRLDVASSRRMLFGSLGLRTPKTPAAEQALREKLSQPIRREKPRLLSDVVSTESESLEVRPDDSWTEKLVVSAVECEREGVTMGPPPFPFEQGWSKTKAKTPIRKHNTVPGAQETDPNGAHFPDEFAPNMSTIPGASTDVIPRSRDESRTISFENEDTEIMTIPTDFEVLPALEKLHLVKDAVIAYKELHVSTETNFQPEVSSYRVARVTQSEDKGSFNVILAKKYRLSGPTYDDETGERLYSKFEVLEHENDDGSDDGVRELEFGALIQPKLVEVSGIQVPDSNPAPDHSGGEAVTASEHGESAYVPESSHGDLPLRSPGPSQVSIEQVGNGAARRNEITTIIREAAFASAADTDSLSQVQSEVSGSTSLHDQNRPQIQLNGEQIKASSSTNPESLPNSSKDSSSHQDAQRLPPEPQADLELTVSEEKAKVILEEANPTKYDNIGFPSPVSEVPPLQPQNNNNVIHGEAGDATVDPQHTDSFLGERGQDGQDSSYHDSHIEEGDASDSQSSLPSLKELLSSQDPRKIVKTHLGTRGLSPPKPKPKTANRRTRRQLSISSSSDHEQNLPPSRQRSIKVSHSQQAMDSRPLSQIPIVDLTTTSNMASPVESGWENRDSIAASTTSNRSDQVVNGTSKANSKAKLTSTSFGEAGLGTKRLLTMKKKGKVQV